MAKTAIHFFTEDIAYDIKQKNKLREWLLDAIVSEGYVLNELNFILCSDEYLLKMNQQYLDHDTYTDVITFDNAGDENTITGDIFISLERVRDNARGLRLSPNTELHRVMVHGTLHLLGYKDKSKADKQRMTAREDHYLGKRNHFNLT